MTENKRFTFMQDTLVKADVFDNEEFVCCTLSVWVEQLVDLLNELNDENKVLKASNGEMEDYLARVEEEIQQFKKENEQLKKFLEEFTENPTQHNLWKLRTALKGDDGND